MTVGLGTGLDGRPPAAGARRAAAERPPLRRHLGRDRASTRAELGIPVEAFDRLDRLDIAIDGADQVAPDRWLVKGGGGAHTREKIVAAAAERFVVIADSSKTVDRIKAPIPLELRAFGLASTLARIAEELGEVALRPDTPAQPRRRRDRRLPRHRSTSPASSPPASP